jgi:hypothetical protein
MFYIFDRSVPHTLATHAPPIVGALVARAYTNATPTNTNIVMPKTDIYGMPIDNTPISPHPRTLREIEECLKYDPHTGALTWKDIGLPLASQPPGEIATRDPKPSGVGKHSIDARFKIPLVVELVRLQETFRAHRIAWFLYTGEWPGPVTHLDHNRKNNAITNLRWGKRIPKPRVPHG